jgi:hypothetical protein
MSSSDPASKHGGPALDISRWPVLKQHRRGRVDSRTGWKAFGLEIKYDGFMPRDEYYVREHFVAEHDAKRAKVAMHTI